MAFNNEQLQIINHTNGPLAVLANPGTGKTSSITERTIQLVNKNHAKDKQLLLITFTNKAKNEMKERIEKKLGKNRISIYTFHSFGSRLLREFGSQINIQSNFTIVEDRNIQTFLKQEWESSYTFKNFGISALYHLLHDSANYNEPFSAYLDGKGYNGKLKYAIEQVRESYIDWKKKHNLVDLSDLQTQALTLLNTDVREKIEQRYKYIMVDEFQDTNEIQLEIVKRISSHNNIVIVGDMRQCIYSWRGAQPKNIERFIKYYNAQVLNLKKNYRSCTEIVRIYNNLISNSTINFGAPTESTIQKSGLVKYFQFDDDEKETKGILKVIKDLITRGKCNYGDIAILYRTNALSKQFEDAFRAANIPYQLIGSKSFYDRREIQEFLALYRWLYNPRDMLSLIKISKMAKCGVGDKTIATIYGNYLKDKDNITINDFKEVSSKLPSKADAFLSYIISLSDLNIAEIGEKFLQKFKVVEKLQEEDKKKEETRADNIISMLNNIKDNNHWTIEELLDIYCVERDEDNSEEDGNNIYLMTIHKSKGLEFRAVILVGFDEKLLPHEMGMENDEDLEEERRAAYVAISRAKEFLVLTSAKYRKLTYNKEFTPSRYLYDLNLNQNQFG